MKIKQLFVLLIALVLCSCSVQKNQENFVSIKGKVLLNVKIANEKFDIHLSEVDNDEVVAVSNVDANGNYFLTIAQDGNYVLSVVNANGKEYKSSYVSFSIEERRISSDSDFTLIVSDKVLDKTNNLKKKEPLIVTGYVEYPVDLNYLEIKVLLCKKKKEKPIRVFTVDESGKFEMSNISDGIYYLCAQSSEENISSWVKLEIENEKVKNEGELKLKLK